MSEGNDARREPRERHEPTRPNGQDPKQSHAGNGTVNHGPDDQGPDKQGPAELGSEEREAAAGQGPEEREPAAGQSSGRTEPAARDRAPEGLAAPAGPDGPDEPDALDGFGSDELALRRMLHQAVQDVEPRDGTLDHLRRAVPARRARKRQAAVGMAAAALFVCTAVPALVHVSNSTGSDANPSAVGHASQAQGGSTEGKGPNGGGSASGGDAGKAEEKGQDGKKEDEKDNGGSDAGTGVTEGADPSSSTIAGGAALCTAAELGTATGSSGAPDSTGAVYGSFRVTNVSSTACTVGGPGSVGTLAGGAADPTKVGTQRHVAGDAAAGLPDPSTESAALLLQPGASYEVKFAWVPSETCPTNNSGGTTGGNPDPSPEPTPSDEPTTTNSSGGATGTSPQLVTEDGMADGSVTVTYTSDTGASTSVTISNACAGTVYWTGVLAAQ
ncbi:hypothetical protein [Streptomyces sp. DH24]|uniref:hypothetical protein n=1 Tax=Streptomyces sp. DH24 TaxID=3040123 RepID=UPI002442AC74|nr:hypothetical protein [Streptomyces sp. DH24]MDG9717346.1 hypothetical protein [Streptomyces sp. DH24]